MERAVVNKASSWSPTTSAKTSGNYFAPPQLSGEQEGVSQSSSTKTPIIDPTRAAWMEEGIGQSGFNSQQESLTSGEPFKPVSNQGIGLTGNLGQPLQPKLTLGKPGDKYEQEADTVAHQVVQRIHAPKLGAKNDLGPPPVPLIQRLRSNRIQEETQSQQETIKPDIQNKLRLKAQLNGETVPHQNLEASIEQAKPNGQPLTDSIKKPMEQSFGADFSGVRIHTDSSSDQLNKSIQASAFTTGQNIFFRQGAYQPETQGGQELIAHELTHVIQQNGSTIRPKLSSNPTDTEEKPQKSPFSSVLEPKKLPQTSNLTANREQQTPPQEDKNSKPLEAKKSNQQTAQIATNKQQNRTSLASTALAAPQPVPNAQGGGTNNPVQGMDQPKNTVNGSNPEQILEQLKNTPPTQASTVYNEAQTVSPQALENQKQQVQATLPEIPPTSGLSPQASPQKTVGQIPAETGKVSGPEETVKPFHSLSKENKTENGGDINISAGERPKVDLSGEANPSQIDESQAQSNQQIQGAKVSAEQGIHQDFGENNIFPKASNTTLKANKELSPVSPPQGKLGEVPAVSPEVVGGLNQGLKPFYIEKIAPEQNKYKIGKEKFNVDSNNARTESNQQVKNLNQETSQKQLEEQNKAKQEVTQARQGWKKELDDTDKTYQEKAGKATQEQREKIDQEKAKGEQEADQKMTEAEQKAQEEKKKTDDEARKKEEEAKKPKSFWEKVGDAFSSIWEGIKNAVSAIFDALRKVVKAIFDAVKTVVTAIIDAVRTVIVGLIKAFGEILKGLVQVVFAAFPEISKKFTDQIDQAVNKATEIVNTVADSLQKGISGILDFLANTLDKLLGLVQDLWKGIFTVIGMIITGQFGELIKRFGNIIEGGKAMSPQFETAGLEELMGGGELDLDKPLAPEEIAQAQQAGVNIPGKAGEGTPQTGEGEELPQAPWTEDKVGVDAVENNMELSPEVTEELIQQTNGEGEVMLAESNEESRSMDSIMSEATKQLQGGGEKQPEEIPDDGLSPKQRASIKWEMMKQGITKWFSDNWPKLLVGLIAAAAVIIAAIVASGGAVLAALPMLMEVLAIVFAADAIVKIGGHLRDYLSKSWDGDIQGGGKSLAKALAAGAIELAMLLTFEVGKVAAKGVKAVAKGAKAAAKGAVKLTKAAFKGVIKGIKYVIEKGKVLFKGIAGSGVGKQFKRLKDLGKGLLDRMRFKAFRVRVAGRRFYLEGLINPWVLLATGEVKEIKKPSSGKKLGEVVGLGKRKRVTIGERNEASKTVKGIEEMDSNKRQKLFEDLDKINDLEKRKVKITGTATPEKFLDNATVDDVVKKLTGDTTSSFKQYYNVLEREGIIDKDGLKKAIKDIKPQGKNVDDVRHTLKEKYRKELLARMTTKNLSNEENHKKMLEITKDLNSSDSGNLAELWYKKLHGGGSSTHVKITPDNMKNLNPGINDNDLISQTRIPDAIIGDTLREQKHIAGKLNDHDLTQFDDFIKLKGKNIPFNNSSVQIKKVKYTFTNPKGVKANAKWMRAQLQNNDNLSFEIFNTKGERKTISKVSELDSTNSSNWLALPP